VPEVRYLRQHDGVQLVNLMGERSLRFRRFIQSHPYCCYCGGSNPTFEIDHAPPKIMFIGKARPDGFVFPACSDCNRASSLSEMVSAMLFRAKPFDKAYSEDPGFIELLRAITSNDRNIILEMFYNDSGLTKEKIKLKRTIGRSDFELMHIGPIVRTYLYNFCAKMGLAAHYHRTNLILPPSGIVVSDIRIGPEFIKGDLPNIEVPVAQIGTLQQGKWDVWDQFAFRSAQTEAPEYGLYQFVFHNNVLITCFVHANQKQLAAPWDEDQARFPGSIFLKPPAISSDKIPVDASASFRSIWKVEIS
jgi:hypothetical protein